MLTRGRAVRFIGMDIHRDFCEVAICEDGKVRSAGRIAASVEQLELLGQSLSLNPPLQRAVFRPAGDEE